MTKLHAKANDQMTKLHAKDIVILAKWSIVPAILFQKKELFRCHSDVTCYMHHPGFMGSVTSQF
jgi:hypothetical protein